MPDVFPNQPDPNLTQPNIAQTPPNAVQPVTTSGLAPTLAACLATVPLFGGVFLALEKQNAFVRFYAMQALIFGVAWAVFSFAVQILAHILWPVGFLIGLLGGLVGLLFFALWIVTLIQAYFGKEWEIPIIAKLAREQLARTTI